MQDFFRNIHEGMKVVDARNHEIGKVDWVQFGADDPATPEVEAGSTEGMEPLEERTLADDIADALRVDDVPDAIRERLLMQGFVRLDADGLFAADRYILPEQISGVSGDTLTLNVDKDSLMKTH